MSTPVPIINGNGVPQTIEFGALPDGAATSVKQDAIVTAVTALTTKTAAQAGSGILQTVPTGSTNGVKLSGITATSVGVEFQLNPGEAVSYILTPFGSSAPSAAPTVRPAVAANLSSSTVQMPWAVNIKGLDIYIISITLNPTYRVM